MLFWFYLIILSCPVVLHSRAVPRRSVLSSNAGTSLKELSSSRKHSTTTLSSDQLYLEYPRLMRRRRAAINQSGTLWKEGIIPYKFSPSVLADRKVKKAFMEAMSKWEQSTCIRFVPIGNNTQQAYLYYNTALGSTCQTAVGKLYQSGPQEVRVESNCTPLVGKAMHELGHSIGFWHEHTRPDRDDYVEILYDNINEDKHRYFDIRKREEIDSLGVPYDLDSIMHYPLNAFSNNYQDTIRLKVDFKGVVGQRTFLSDKDIEQANLLYKCQDMTKKRPLGCNGEIIDGDVVALRVQALTGGLGHNWLRCKKDHLHCRPSGPSEATCAGYHFDNNDWKHCRHDTFRIFALNAAALADPDTAIHVGDTVVLESVANRMHCLTCISGFKCKLSDCSPVFSNKSNVSSDKHFIVEAVGAKKGDVLKDQHIIGLRSTQDNNLIACKDNGRKDNSRVPQCRRRSCNVDALNGHSLDNCSDAQFVITKRVTQQKMPMSSNNCRNGD